MNNINNNKTKLTNESSTITKSLKRYIESRDEFAFLLNGPWGSGKTFFIKEFLKKISGYGINTYFSLNGSTSISNLYSEILYKICVGPGKFEDIKEFANDIFKDGNSDKLLGKLSFVPKLANSVAVSSMEKIIDLRKNHTVLVLDDLERFLNQEDVDINEFVGVITRILNKNIKIIMIADETKINKEDNTKEKFYVVKEKIINKTINFVEYNSDSAIEIVRSELDFIFKNYEENIKDIFYKWIEHFYSYIKREKQINLRMIKSVMFSFDEIVQESKNGKYKADLLATLLENSFLSIYIYTNIYWNNLEINELENFMGKSFKQVNEVISNKLMSDENQGLNTDFGKRIENLILNITDDSLKDNFLLTKEMFNLVTKDELDFDNYVKDIDLMLLLNTPKQDKENRKKFVENENINILVHSLNNPTANSEDELKKIENTAVLYINETGIDFIKKLALYESLYELYDKDLYFHEKCFDELTKDMIIFIDKYEFDDYESKDVIFNIKSMIKLISNGNPLRKLLEDKLEKAYVKCLKYEIKNLYNIDVNHVFNIPSKILFDELLKNNEIEEKIANNTGFGYELIRYVNNNKLQDINRESDEIKNLEIKFYEKISSYDLEKINDRVKEYRYKIFKIKCNEIIDHLRKEQN